MNRGSNVRVSDADRQYSLGQRRRATGMKRIGIWIPGDVHKYVTEQANREGISLQDMIIRKLRT